jgi:hypothetical protein
MLEKQAKLKIQELKYILLRAVSWIPKVKCMIEPETHRERMLDKTMLKGLLQYN